MSKIAEAFDMTAIKENVMSNTAKTALVTGANSGLGYEAAFQLAEEGYGRVIVTTRTAEKGTSTVSKLIERSGKDIFEFIVLDNDDLSTVSGAVGSLSSVDALDVVILNAGIAPPAEVRMTVDGLEAVVSSTLVGHHAFTMSLLAQGKIREGARIVMAGSEAARDDVPTFKTVDFDRLAAESFDGSLEAAIEAQIKMTPPTKYKGADIYATAKMLAIWWAAELAPRLPEGATVNVVSPGSTPDTNAIRNANWFMRNIMVPAFRIIPGMSHEVEDGAARYIEATRFDSQVSGKFFASPLKKMTGTLTEIDLPHLDNQPAQMALWNVVDSLVSVASTTTG